MTHSMRGWAAVTGVAERKPERWTDGETTLDMLSKIGVAAIADAGLELGDIDGLLCHPMGGVPMLVPSLRKPRIVVADEREPLPGGDLNRRRA